MATINKTFVDNIKEAGDYRDESLKGFVLDVRDTGVKTYKIHSRIKGGGLITYTIGVHGQPWNATSARKEAENILYMMRNGEDPRALIHKMQEEQQALIKKEVGNKIRNELTVRRAFQEWSETTHCKHGTKILFRQVIFKHMKNWLDIPLADITADMVCKRYDEVAKNTVSSANNAFRGLRMLYGWASSHYEDTSEEIALMRNPVLALAKRKKWQNLTSRNQEYITDEDLKPWFEAVSNLENKDMADYFIFLLITGLRKSEAAGLRFQTNGKDDVDFKRGRFTVHETKNGTSHCLPMTDYVRNLLKRRADKYRASSDFVFPGQFGKGHIHDVRSHQLLITEASGVEFTPHQLRRTFSYAAERCRLGVTEQKKLLNHLWKSDITTANYSPREIDDLLDPLKTVEEFLLKHTGVETNSNTIQAPVTLRLIKSA